MSLRPPGPPQPLASAPVLTTAAADGDMANEQVLAELQRLRRAEENRARTGKRITVGLLLGVLALVLFWNTGRMDPWLSGIGLNKNTCVKNGFGATFCGDDADAYQKNIAQVQADLGSFVSSAQTAKANLRSALPAAEAYYADNGTYAGMDIVALFAIDSGISPSLTVAAAASESYCLTETVSGETWSVAGPGASSADYKNNATCA